MSWLKQSTAVTIVMPPMLDSTDGNTPETGLTISQSDIRLSKNGGAYAQTNNVAGATHMEVGNYSVPLDTTDTATLGILRVSIHESGALAVWREFTIIPANVYDSIVLSTDKLQTDVRQWKGTDTSVPDVAGIPNINITHLRGTYLNPTVAGVLETNITHISDDSTAADNAELAFDGTGYGFTGCTVPTVTTLTGHTAQTGDSFARIGATGSGLSSLAPASTALTDVTWTDAKAVFLDHSIATVDTNVDTLLTRITAAVALASALATAQTDLDKITGTDGVTLATAQALYAPNKVVPDVAGTAAGLHSTTDTAIAGLNDITVADIKAGIADGTYDLEEMMRLIFASCCAKVSGGGTTTITFRDGPDSKDRITATVDSNGNRTATTLDGSV